MKQLSVSVRHNDQMVYADFDESGYIKKWRYAGPVSEIIKQTHVKDIPFTTLYFVQVEETKDTIRLEIIDELPLTNLPVETKNVALDKSFNTAAEQYLEMYMEDNHFVPIFNETPIH